MIDKELTEEIAKRLNSLCEDSEVRRALGDLLCQRVPISEEVAVRHPTLQCWTPGEEPSMDQHMISFVGVLNGILGVQENGCGVLSVCVEVTEEGRVSEPWELVAKDPFFVLGEPQ